MSSPLNSAFEFLRTREWDFYEFGPPLFALFLSVYLLPQWERGWRAQVIRLIRDSYDENVLTLVDAIAKDRELRLNCLVTAPATLVSLVPLVDSRGLLITAIVIALVIGLPLMANVLSSTPGTLQTELWGKLTKHTWLTGVIAALNVVVIVLLVLAQPQAKQQ